MEKKHVYFSFFCIVKYYNSSNNFMKVTSFMQFSIPYTIIYTEVTYVGLKRVVSYEIVQSNINNCDIKYFMCIYA